ncbi:hypothetical protein Droror1_Dr00009694 [Drosera rotundifolia]
MTEPSFSDIPSSRSAALLRRRGCFRLGSPEFGVSDSEIVMRVAWWQIFFKYRRPRQWLNSGGLGAMGLGLPAAIGAAVACPDSAIIEDGNGCFIMNVQELATARVKIS